VKYEFLEMVRGVLSFNKHQPKTAPSAEQEPRYTLNPGQKPRLSSGHDSYVAKLDRWLA